MLHLGPTARAQMVLNIIEKHIGLPTPYAHEIATELRCSRVTVENAITKLRSDGRLVTTGRGNTRIMRVPGKGDTTVRIPDKRRASVIDEVGPVRVLDSFPCIRCGTARGCGCYTARLTSAARLPVHVGA